MLHFVRYGEDNFMIYLYDRHQFHRCSYCISVYARILFNLKFYIYIEREKVSTTRQQKSFFNLHFLNRPLTPMQQSPAPLNAFEHHTPLTNPKRDGRFSFRSGFRDPPPFRGLYKSWGRKFEAEEFNIGGLEEVVVWLDQSED